MPKIFAQLFGCYARAIFSCVHVLNLGAAHMMSIALSRAVLSLDSKLRIYFDKNANPMVLHLSGMCVSHRDAGAYRGHDIIATVTLEVAGCESS